MENDIRAYVAEGELYLADERNRVLFYCIDDSVGVKNGRDERILLVDEELAENSDFYGIGDRVIPVKRIDEHTLDLFNGDDPKTVTYRMMMTRDECSCLLLRHHAHVQDFERQLKLLKEQVEEARENYKGLKRKLNEFREPSFLGLFKSFVES